MSSESFIETVSGRVKGQDLGHVLVHEHILVDFIGAEHISKERYDREEVVRVMTPYLKDLRAQGIDTLFECTPMYLGRDPLLLNRVARESGLHIVTNTGLYAAGERDARPEPFLPDYAFELSAEALAGGWLKEWFEGIEGTSVRPGFIKIGVNPGKLREISRKIVQAAAITSRHSGLAIAAHTVKGEAALEVLEILEATQVAPGRFIYVHAQGEEDLEYHLECARQGAWIEFDGIREDTVEKHLDLVMKLLEAGIEEQLLVSQDAGWYRPGEADGGKIREYTYLVSEFLPKLRQRGVPEETIAHLLIHNPRRAFCVEKA